MILEDIQAVSKSDFSLREKYIYLRKLLERYCKETTANESLQFPSLFSRIVFLSQKYNLPKELEWELQNFRVRSLALIKDHTQNVDEKDIYYATQAIINLYKYINGDRLKIEIKQSKVNSSTTIPYRLRAQIIDIDKLNQVINAHTDAFTHREIVIRYNVETINEEFNKTIEKLWIGAQINLINCTIDKTGFYIPKIIVLEPDYMIDASVIAECFQNYGNTHLHYFRRKFEKSTNSHYILLGNLANFFLDELIYADNAKDLSFDEVFLKSFRQMPFEYTSCSEIKNPSHFREFIQKAKCQFENIKRVVSEDLLINGFDIANCILEPSFYSEEYGFQGRLDLLQTELVKDSLTRIIELKSGKPPYPRTDITKIASNHEAQTTVYRLMIQSALSLKSRQIYAAILYSSVDNKGENLRLTATYKHLEREIINIRNLIVATERDLYTGNEETVATILKELFEKENYERIPDFFANKLRDLNEVIGNASNIEREYVFRFVSFVSRELYLQKMGDENYDSSNSISALWNTPFEERKDNLELIDKLVIEEIDDSKRDMKLRLRRTDTTSFVNFREGEVCILYPRQDNNDTILTNQVLKGNIVNISDKDVILRFRYKQKNKNFFSKHHFWVVEHDRLDHSYNIMFKSLFAFLASNKVNKNLLLGLQEPETSYIPNLSLDESLKSHKKQIVLDKALSAKDYFLIVGPPGTGKTSIFIRELIATLHSDEQKQILVLAYTNRAVDELCSAICSAFDESETNCNKYIRIGTELSCAEPYRHRLLQIISHKAESRSELMVNIDHCRVFVGTVASITGKPELFDMKKFDIALIDEASQILEPQIIGLLPMLNKFIMIGDHNQLSTITLQNENNSKVNNPLLNDIGLVDCRESLFERLYRTCKKNGWKNAYDTLTFHGRMHEEIADFVNIHFYNNQLQIATERQREPLFYNEFNKDDEMQRFITQNRVAFFPNKSSYTIAMSDKMNLIEAEIVKQIVNSLYELYKLNNLIFDTNKTIGIIAPFRNQIALIRQKLKDTYIPNPEKIMVDTVERFQGSQRDIIIISCCMNKPYQLRSLCNMNRDKTVDRKLNVALTRAREQLFIVGNEEIMKENSIYKKLIESMQ